MNDVNEATFDQEAVNEEILSRATPPQPPPAPLPDPVAMAMGKMLVTALNREVGLEAMIIDLQRRIAELEGLKAA